MDVIIRNGYIKLYGHQTDAVLCAGISGIVGAYQLMYPDKVSIANGVNRADDVVTVRDNGEKTYQMVLGALRALDPTVYDINVYENMENDKE